jgi:hypothetical protein
LADYVTVATLALPLPEDDSAELLQKAKELAAAVQRYEDVFEADPGGDPEVVHRFARMLLALEEFELAGLCPEQRLERQRCIERQRGLVERSGHLQVGLREEQGAEGPEWWWRFPGTHGSSWRKM